MARIVVSTNVHWHQWPIRRLPLTVLTIVWQATQHWMGTVILRAHHSVMGPLHWFHHKGKNKQNNLLLSCHQLNMPIPFECMEHLKQSTAPPNTIQIHHCPTETAGGQPTPYGPARPHHQTSGRWYHEWPHYETNTSKNQTMDCNRNSPD